MRKGISLIEMVVSLAVSAILLISVFKIVNMSIAMSFNIVERDKELHVAFRTFDVIERDLNRSIGNFSWEPPSLASTLLLTVGTKRIRYYVSGDRIIRRSGNSYNTVTEFVKSAGFMEKGGSVRFFVDEGEILIGIEGG